MAAAPAAAMGSAPTGGGGSGGRDAPVPLIVMLHQENATATDLLDVCGSGKTPYHFDAATIRRREAGAGGGAAARAREALAAWRCRQHVGGLCKRVFLTDSMRGFAGVFQPSQITALDRCFPGWIAFVELDSKVTHMAAPAAAAPPPALPPFAAQKPPSAPPAGSNDGGAANGTPSSDLGGNASSAAGIRQLPPRMGLTPKTPEPPPLAPAPLPLPAGVPWNLDRIDQRSLPLDGLYTADRTTSPPPAGGGPASAPAAAVSAAGAGVTLYVIDSGIRSTHDEFAAPSPTGAAAADTTRVRPGFDFVTNKQPLEATDCDGRGALTARGGPVTMLPSPLG